MAVKQARLDVLERNWIQPAQPNCAGGDHW